MISHLMMSGQYWYMDRIFIVAPLLFTQLYVIRVPLGESAVTRVYAFLPNKHQSTYEELFTAIQDRCTELGFQADPTTITLDFEQAVINGVMSSFGPQVNIHGYFYHLTQATWRKVQTLGLVQRHREEQEVKLFCGMLDGLALPVDDVPEGMTYLQEHTPEGLEPLLDYFDNTYVSEAFQRIPPPTTFRWIQPSTQDASHVSYVLTIHMEHQFHYYWRGIKNQQQLRGMEQRLCKASWTCTHYHLESHW